MLKLKPFIQCDRIRPSSPLRTLSGILRLSPRRSVLTLKVRGESMEENTYNLLKTDQGRFVRLLKNSHIPARQDPIYNKAIRQRHAAILGICALVDSYPYTVEEWMPELLTNILAEHTYDPVSWHIVHLFEQAFVNDLILLILDSYINYGSKMCGKFQENSPRYLA